MNRPRRTILLCVAWLFAAAHAFPPAARAQTRWKLDADGGISWAVEPGKAHQDHIEMSGRRVSVIVTYGVDDKGKLILNRHVVFPLLRFAPNRTRDHLALTFGDDATPRVLINRALPRGDVTTAFHQRGIMRIESLL